MKKTIINSITTTKDKVEVRVTVDEMVVEIFDITENVLRGSITLKGIEGDWLNTEEEATFITIPSRIKNKMEVVLKWKDTNEETSISKDDALMRCIIYDDMADPVLVEVQDTEDAYAIIMQACEEAYEEAGVDIYE